MLSTIQVLVKVDPGTVSNEKQKSKINLILVFNTGTVLQKANSGLSLRVLAGKKQPPSTGVLSRKGNQKQTRVLVVSQEKKVEYILCVHGHVLIHALKHTDSSFSKIPNAKLCDIF